jgi:hypothetical protein
MKRNGPSCAGSPTPLPTALQYLLPSILVQFTPLPEYPPGHGPQLNEAIKSVQGTPRKHGSGAHSLILNRMEMF